MRPFQGWFGLLRRQTLVPDKMVSGQLIYFCEAHVFSLILKGSYKMRLFKRRFWVEQISPAFQREQDPGMNLVKCSGHAYLLGD